MIKSVRQMHNEAVRARQSCGSVSLVPTMGFLHEGHIALIRKAREISEYVIVSIFVNPTQFGSEEDLNNYPRDLGRDIVVCEKESVDAVFVPDSSELYLDDHSVFVVEEDISTVLCGIKRPAHFKGVATIVAKLFNIIDPDFAIFGAKDFQQLRVIERMTRDLNYAAKIVSVPVVRESDGLAMSSRNKYLSAEERTFAPVLFRALKLAQKLFLSGEVRTEVIQEKVLGFISDNACDMKVEYLDFVDYKTLRHVEQSGNDTYAVAAAWIGKTRLIDNIKLSV